MNVTLSMTGEQHARLQERLFPADGKEAAAIMLCGRRAGTDRHRLLVKNVHLVPHESCTVHSPLSIAWPTDLMVPWLEQANRSGLSVVKIHSHPGDYARFSNQDDQSDAEPSPALTAGSSPASHTPASIMLSDGRISAGRSMLLRSLLRSRPSPWWVTTSTCGALTILPKDAQKSRSHFSPSDMHRPLAKAPPEDSADFQLGSLDAQARAVS